LELPWIGGFSQPSCRQVLARRSIEKRPETWGIFAFPKRPNSALYRGLLRNRNVAPPPGAATFPRCHAIARAAQFACYTTGMSALVSQNVIEQIHASGHRLVLAVTGGGSRAIADLLEVPGASASVLEAVVPYSAASLERWLGGPVDQYCSERTARAMAMAAFERARALAHNEARRLRGIGATASLATNRPKRGVHRIHVAWQSAEVTAVASCELAKGERTRGEEEQVAARLVIDSVAEACGLTTPPLLDAPLRAAVKRRTQQAQPLWTELLLGERASVATGGAPELHAAAPGVLFPGAFNPLHSGHERMAALATERYGKPVAFELSITNVDKPALDYIEIADRLQQLAERRVLLTRAPTFVEKARLVPGCVFIVGADTLQRIAAPEYYNNSEARRDRAIAAIAGQGCRFLVFGRMFAGRFVTLADLHLPAALQSLCEAVTAAQFRDDISSTKLRGS
jgi:nicotinamide mononucleotide (NMN) deamidase PncC